MAEITRQRVGELMRGVFSVLLPHPEGLPAKDVLRKVEEVVPPTPFEKTEYERAPGVRRFEKIIRFSTINAVKAGWLTKTKGRWAVTELGRKAYTEFQAPDAFKREAERLYKEWAKSQPEEGDGDIETVASGGTAASTTLEEAEETAWSEVSTYLASMQPYEFQDLVAGLLRAMGYHVAWVAPPGADRGLDILAHNDPLGTTTPRIKVQVKHRADKARPDELRSFMSLLSEHDVGIFVSAGGFTPQSQIEARTQENRRITLVDLERLFDLWVEHFDRLTQEERRRLPLKPVYFLEPPTT